jgi:hypothetical protein
MLVVSGEVSRYNDGLESRGVDPGGGKRFTSPRSADRLWGPPSFQSNWYLRLIPRDEMRQGREANHSLPPSTEVKNGGAILQYHSPIRIRTGKNLSLHLPLGVHFFSFGATAPNLGLG